MMMTVISNRGLVLNSNKDIYSWTAITRLIEFANWNYDSKKTDDKNLMNWDVGQIYVQSFSLDAEIGNELNW